MNTKTFILSVVGFSFFAGMYQLSLVAMEKNIKGEQKATSIIYEWVKKALIEFVEKYKNNDREKGRKIFKEFITLIEKGEQIKKHKNTFYTALFHVLCDIQLNSSNIPAITDLFSDNDFLKIMPNVLGVAKRQNFVEIDKYFLKYPSIKKLCDEICYDSEDEEEAFFDL